jgi:hypothetical protein
MVENLHKDKWDLSSLDELLKIGKEINEITAALLICFQIFLEMKCYLLTK